MVDNEMWPLALKYCELVISVDTGEQSIELQIISLRNKA